MPLDVGPRERAVAGAYVVLLVVVAAAADGFLSPGNLRDLAVAHAPTLVAALGMTLVMVARQIDISIGSQLAVGGVLAGLLAKEGVPMPVVAVLVLAAGALMGALNGALVTAFALPSIVVTLATMVSLREGLRWTTQGADVLGLPDDFQWLGLGQAAGRGLVVGGALVLCALFAWASRGLAGARAVYATGSDAEMARLLGVRTRRVTFIVFVLMGILTAAASVLGAIRFPQVQTNAGIGFELQVIAAVVVGGTAVSGGRGTIPGTLLGVMFLGTIGTALTFLHVSAHWEKAIQGAIILLAVAAEGFGHRPFSGPGLVTERDAPLPSRETAYELVLAGLVAAEIAVFSAIGHNFFSVQNVMETVRLSAELGLLAVALTAVLVTGGIDLSVGSMMGLCAVVFGLLVKDGGLGEAPAAVLAVFTGALGGLLNAALITRLALPPLIVTLGTYSLYRGLAEGLTAGVRNFTDFDASFLLLGQGYLGGWVPVQAPILVAVACAYGWLLHRTTVGRGLYAIGFSPEGARHAGVPVASRQALVYGLSGLVAGLAAVVYVAHLGQAKADAGTSYELMAITAVVLGGTSIFGGRGTIVGTLLGLVAVSVLQNGLRLADLPSELAGILVGVLLVSALLANQALIKKGGRP